MMPTNQSGHQTVFFFENLADTKLAYPYKPSNALSFLKEKEKKGGRYPETIKM